MINLINQLNDFLWGYIVIAMMVLCALYFTFRLKAVQFTMIHEMFHLLTHSSKKTNAIKDNMETGYAMDKETRNVKPISPFHAFAIGLSSRVGTGNLAGVASAIFIGGPGSVFWMWMLALLGASSSFVESTLAQLYKRRDKEPGIYYGGPAYYMQYGMHKRWMGIIFAVLICLSYSLATQMIQSKTMADAFSVSIDQAMGNPEGTSNIYVAIAVTLATAFIIFGGVQRIAKFAAGIVPVMAIGYIILALYVIIVNITMIPDILKLIVTSAFGLEPATGGLVGLAVMQGVKRGLYSNEAGEGTVPNAAAIAETSHPVKQGLLQALGVYCDTLIICTCTAIIVLVSGLWTGDEDGILLTQSAFEQQMGSWGRYFLTAAILMFAYSTIIAGYFYGESNLRFIFGKNANPNGSEKKENIAIFIFRIATAAVILAGAVMTLQDSFSIVDLLMGIMTICNIIAIVWLAPRAKMLLDDYKRQRREHKDPVFHKDVLPEELQKDIECW